MTIYKQKSSNNVNEKGSLVQKYQQEEVHGDNGCSDGTSQH